MTSLGSIRRRSGVFVSSGSEVTRLFLDLFQLTCVYFSFTVLPFLPPIHPSGAKTTPLLLCNVHVILLAAQGYAEEVVAGSRVPFFSFFDLPERYRTSSYKNSSLCFSHPFWLGYFSKETFVAWTCYRDWRKRLSGLRFSKKFANASNNLINETNKVKNRIESSKNC